MEVTGSPGVPVPASCWRVAISTRSSLLRTRRVVDDHEFVRDEPRPLRRIRLPFEHLGLLPRREDIVVHLGLRRIRHGTAGLSQSPAAVAASTGRCAAPAATGVSIRANAFQPWRRFTNTRRKRAWSWALRAPSTSARRSGCWTSLSPALAAASADNSLRASRRVSVRPSASVQVKRRSSTAPIAF